MATLNQEYLTLSDLAKRWDPNGAPAQMVDAITREGAALQDMPFVQANGPTSHTTSLKTGKPAIAYRKFNEGVPASKSKADQIVESIAMIEGKSIVDCELASIGGNPSAVRAAEDGAFLPSFNEEIETGLFYNSTKNAPEKFHGLSARYDALTGQPASQIVIVDTAAAGNDNTSIWLVGWGPATVHGIYPPGSSGGLSTHDMGEQMVDDGTGKTFRAYVTVFNWKVGLAVRDWRYVVRIANIDATTLTGTGTTLIDGMIEAYHKLKSMNGVRPVFYANRTIGTFLHKQARAGAANTITLDNIAGTPISRVLGIPVRTTDAILSTEAPVA
jgi:hypothetical protein